MAIDMETLKFLSDGQKQSYMDYEKLIDMPGWARFKEYLTRAADEQMKRLIHAPSWEINRAAAGAFAAYNNVLEFETILDAEYTNYAVENGLKSKDDGEFDVDNQT